jgi:hypothetical protein
MTTFRQIAIVVEGQTESAFVSEILAPYLQATGVYVTPVIVTTSRLADGTTFKGGGMVWRHYENDIRRLLRASHFHCVSILLDFYAYPRNAPGSDCCDRMRPASVPSYGRRRWVMRSEIHDSSRTLCCTNSRPG